MCGRERDAFADLYYRLIHEPDGSLAVAALIRYGRLKFAARVLQQRQRRIHMRLGADRVANSETRCDESSNLLLFDEIPPEA